MPSHSHSDLALQVGKRNEAMIRQCLATILLTAISLLGCANVAEKPQSRNDAIGLARVEQQDLDIRKKVEVGRTASQAPSPAKLGKGVPLGFLTYSYLLFTSSEWNSESRANELQKVVAAFGAFGEAIGPRHAAVSFVLQPGRKRVDVEMAKQYADALGISYNDGPFVVVSRQKPDEPPTDVVIIKLAGVAADRVVYVLNVLEQDVRREVAIQKRALLYQELKQRILSTAERYPELARALADTVSGSISSK